MLALLHLRVNLACVCSLQCDSGPHLLIVHSGTLLIASPKHLRSDYKHHLGKSLVKDQLRAA